MGDTDSLTDMKLVQVFPILCQLNQNLRSFWYIFHNCVIAWLQLLETLRQSWNLNTTAGCDAVDI